MNEKAVFFMLAVFVLLFLGVFAASTYSHEFVHVAINNAVGVESEWHYTIFPLGAATVPANATKSGIAAAAPYHLMNEIVSYNTSTIAFAILFAALIIALSIALRD